jgi:GNAT superfamily N-acetyltransferase
VITEATKDDLSEIFKLVMALENERPFCKPDYHSFSEYWGKIIEAGTGVIFKYINSDITHGFLSGFVIPEMNSGTLISVESLWYVTPEKRKEGIGKRLLSRFEDWSRLKSAKYICTAKPYRKSYLNGYKSLETFYVKEI